MANPAIIPSQLSRQIQLRGRPEYPGDAMGDIAEFVGRSACRIFWGFVPICTSGQSVAPIGYGAIALILGVAIAWVVTKRAY